MDVEAKAGVPFEVVLERHATAGYAWEVQELPDGVAPAGPSETAVPPGAAPGDPSRQAFLFVAEEPGAYRIVLASRRRWESAPARVETVDVTVRAAREGPGGR